jgi:hypothetical protein
MRSAIVAFVLLLAGCTTTTYGSLRAPPSACTQHCAYLTSDESRFRCMQQCPGALYSESSCAAVPSPGLVCTNDTRVDTDGVVAALVLLDVMATVADPHTHSCHHRYGH